MKNRYYGKQLQFVLVVCFLALIIFGIQHVRGKGEIGDNAKTSTPHIDAPLLPYLHGDNSFQFTFPSYLKFSNLAEGEGATSTETVVFGGTSNGESFQIFIGSYQVEQPLTLQDIIQANVDLEISDVKDISIDGEKAFAFTSRTKNSSTSTYEIWFVHQAKIYQISTYPTFKNTLTSILSTWKWLE